jgi:interferon-induced GTP-binding protein Mx1
MEESFDREVRPYLDLVDALRHVGVHQEISLPQIAVMGDQSSGKSSVLQSLSGIPFPKGTGLVTRCPTQLILSKSSKNASWIAEVSINFKDSTKKQPTGTGTIKSIEKLTEVIEVLTNNLTNGEINGFSTDIIVIKISSPDSPDLTIIDLPGIIRTVTKDQDKAVIQQVNNLIDSYMGQVNTIILAVIPANQDIATIDILERAHKVDPTGERTLGVLTKPDLIGEGNEEEIVQVISNIRKPLLLGYVMLRNLSQKEVNESKNGLVSIKDARDKENNYFKNHKYFKLLPTHLFGADNLSIRLTQLLVKCIKISLPSMKWELESLLENTENEIRLLGVGMN